MREASCLSPIVCWMVEAKERFDGPMEYFDKGYYKHLIVYAQSYSELIKSDERPVHYMPHYAPLEKGISEKMPGDRKYDWVFLGAHSPWREICLSQLMQAYPNGLILGPRWNRLSRKFKSLSKIAHDGYLDGERSLECYREARVGVDIPSKQNWVDNGVTMRVPELISCGVHVLTRHIPEIKILPYYDDLSVTMYEDEDDIVHGMKKSLETVMTLTREQLESSSKKSFRVSGVVKSVKSIHQYGSSKSEKYMKLTAIILFFRDTPFMEALISSIYPVCDSIHAVTSYDRTFGMDRQDPDESLSRLLSLDDPGNKLKVSVIRHFDGIPGKDNEARLRNAAIMQDTNSDYFLIVDTDEIFETNHLMRVWSEVQKTKWAAYRIPSFTYFKSWNHRIDPPDGYAPLCFLKRGFYFKHLRQVDWSGPARYREYLRTGRKPKTVILEDDSFLHHGSYVGDDDRIQKKISSWGHAHEVVNDWFDNVWKKFDSQSKNISPVTPEKYAGVKHIPTKELPLEISSFSWPDGWIER